MSKYRVLGIQPGAKVRFMHNGSMRDGKCILIHSKGETKFVLCRLKEKFVEVPLNECQLVQPADLAGRMFTTGGELV